MYLSWHFRLVKHIPYIILIMTFFAPISSKIKLSGAARHIGLMVNKIDFKIKTLQWWLLLFLGWCLVDMLHLACLQIIILSSKGLSNQIDKSQTPLQATEIITTPDYRMHISPHKNLYWRLVDATEHNFFRKCFPFSIQIMLWFVVHMTKIHAVV